MPNDTIQDNLSNAENNTSRIAKPGQVEYFDGTPINDKGNIDFVDLWFNKSSGGSAEADAFHGSKELKKDVELINPDEFVSRYPQYDKMKKENPEQFQDLWNRIEGSYKLYVNGNFYKDKTSLPLYPNTALHQSWGIPDSERNIGKNYFKATSQGAFDTLGDSSFIQMKTDAELATEAAVYKNKYGFFVPNDNMSDDVVKQWEFSTKPGEPERYWKELGDNENADPSRIQSAWGDPTMYSNSKLGTVGRAAWSGTAPMIATGVGTLVDVIGDLVSSEEQNKWSDRFGREWNNWGNKFQVKNEDEMKGAFDNASSFLYAFTNGITQMAGMVAAAYVGGGASGLLSMIPRVGVAAKTAVAAAAAGRSITIGQWLAKGAIVSLGERAALTLGAAEAAASWREEMRRMGISESESAKWYLPFFVATYASENIFSANLLQKGYRSGFAAATAEALRKADARLFAETGKKFVNLTEPEKLSFIKGLTKNFTKVIPTLDKFLKTPGAEWAKSGGEEFVEENVEGFMQVGVQHMYNAIAQGQANNIIKEYNGKEFDLQADPKTGIVTYKIGGQSVDFNEWKAAKNDYTNALKVANGEMVFKNPSVNFDEGFIAGMSAMVTGGLFNRQHHQQVKQQDKSFANLAYDEIIDPSKEKIHDEATEKYGYDNHAENDKYTLESGVKYKGSQDISMLDAQRNVMRQQINLYKELIKSSGITNPDVLSRIGGDKQLISEAATLIKQSNENKKQIEELSKVAGNEELIANLTNDTKVKQQQLVEILEPEEGSQYSKRYSEKVKQNALIANLAQQKVLEGYMNSKIAIDKNTRNSKEYNEAIIQTVEENSNLDYNNLKNVYKEAIAEQTIREQQNLDEQKIQHEKAKEAIPALLSKVEGFTISKDINASIKALQANLSSFKEILGQSQVGVISKEIADKYTKAYQNAMSAINLSPVELQFNATNNEGGQLQVGESVPYEQYKDIATSLHGDLQTEDTSSPEVSKVFNQLSNELPSFEEHTGLTDQVSKLDELLIGKQGIEPTFIADPEKVKQQVYSMQRLSDTITVGNKVDEAIKKIENDSADTVNPFELLTEVDELQKKNDDMKNVMFMQYHINEKIFGKNKQSESFLNTSEGNQDIRMSEKQYLTNRFLADQIDNKLSEVKEKLKKIEVIKNSENAYNRAHYIQKVTFLLKKMSTLDSGFDLETISNGITEKINSIDIIDPKSVMNGVDVDMEKNIKDNQAKLNEVLSSLYKVRKELITEEKIKTFMNNTFSIKTTDGFVLPRLSYINDYKEGEYKKMMDSINTEGDFFGHISKLSLRYFINTLTLINGRDIIDIENDRQDLYSYSEYRGHGSSVEQQINVNFITAILDTEGADKTIVLNMIRKIITESRKQANKEVGALKFDEVNLYATNVISIRGDGGVGKTSQVMPEAMLLSRLKNQSVMAVGINEDNKNNLKKQLLGLQSIGTVSNVTTKDMYQMGDVKGYDIVMIDEAAYGLQIKNIPQFIKSLNDAGNPIVFLIGDQSQMRETDSSFKGAYFETMGAVTYPMVYSYRNNNALVNTFNKWLRKWTLNNAGTVSNIPVAWSENKGNTMVGLNYSSTEEEVYAKFINTKNTNSALVLYDYDQYLNKDNNPLLKTIMDNPELKSRVYILNIDTNSKPEKDSPSTLQSSEREEVYVVIPRSSVKEQQDYYRALYTASTRAQNYINIFGIPGKNATSQKEASVWSEMPLAKDNKDAIKKQLVQDIKDILGDKLRKPIDSNTPSEVPDEVNYLTATITAGLKNIIDNNEDITSDAVKDKIRSIVNKSKQIDNIKESIAKKIFIGNSLHPIDSVIYAGYENSIKKLVEQKIKEKEKNSNVVVEIANHKDYNTGDEFNDSNLGVVKLSINANQDRSSVIMNIGSRSLSYDEFHKEVQSGLMTKVVSNEHETGEESFDQELKKHADKGNSYVYSYFRSVAGIDSKQIKQKIANKRALNPLLRNFINNGVLRSNLVFFKTIEALDANDKVQTYSDVLTTLISVKNKDTFVQFMKKYLHDNKLSNAKLINEMIEVVEQTGQLPIEYQLYGTLATDKNIKGEQERETLKSLRQQGLQQSDASTTQIGDFKYVDLGEIDNTKMIASYGRFVTRKPGDNPLSYKEAMKLFAKQGLTISKNVVQGSIDEFNKLVVGVKASFGNELMINGKKEEYVIHFRGKILSDAFANVDKFKEYISLSKVNAELRSSSKLKSESKKFINILNGTDLQNFLNNNISNLFRYQNAFSTTPDGKAFEPFREYFKVVKNEKGKNVVNIIGVGYEGKYKTLVDFIENFKKHETTYWNAIKDKYWQHTVLNHENSTITNTDQLVTDSTRINDPSFYIPLNSFQAKISQAKVDNNSGKPNIGDITKSVLGGYGVELSTMDETETEVMIDETDSNVNTESIKRKYGNTDLLTDTFGDAYHINIVKRILGLTMNAYSLFSSNVNMTTSDLGEIYSLAESEFVGGQFNAVADDLVKSIGVKYSEVTGKMLLSMTNIEKGKYINYQLSKPEIIRTVAQSMFKNFDIESLNTSKENHSGLTDKTGIDTMKLMGDVIKWQLSIIPYSEFRVNEEGIYEKVGVKQGQFVGVNDLWFTMLGAMQEIDKETKGGDIKPITEAFVNKMREIADRVKMDNYRSNNILSFLDRFYGVSAIGYSEYLVKLEEYAKAGKEHIAFDLNDKKFRLSDSTNKASFIANRDLSMFFNAMLANLSSNTQHSWMKTKVVQKEEENATYKTSILSTNAWSDIKNKLVDKIYQLHFTPSGVRENSIDALRSKKAGIRKWNVTKYGLSHLDANGKEEAFIVVRDGNIEFAKEFDKFSNQKLSDISKFLGMASTLNKNTLQAIYENKAPHLSEMLKDIANTTTTNQETKGLLARGLMNMFWALDSTIDVMADITEENNTDHTKEEKIENISNITKNAKYSEEMNKFAVYTNNLISKVDTFEEISSDDTNEGIETKERYFKPMDFFQFLSLIAYVDDTNKGNGVKKFTRDAEGKKHFNFGFKTSLTEAFDKGSFYLRNKYKDIFESRPEEHKYSLFFDPATGEYNNDLVDPKSTFNILQIHKYSGITKDQSGTTSPSLSDVQSAAFNMYVEAVLKSEGGVVEELFVPLYNQGANTDLSIVRFTVDGGGKKKIHSVSTVDGELNVQLDESQFVKRVNNKFNQLKREFELSKLRFVEASDVFNYLGQENVNTPKEIAEYFKNVVESVKTQGVDALNQLGKELQVLSLNKDYILKYDENDNIIDILPGKALQFNYGPIYNYEKLLEWNESKSKITTMNKLYSDEYKRLCKQMIQNGVKIPASVKSLVYENDGMFKTNSVGDIVKFNPIIKSFMFSHMMVNNNLASLTIGNTSNHKNTIESLKRQKDQPGLSGIYTDPKGMGATYLIGHHSEILMEHPVTKRKINPFDGLAMGMPLARLFFDVSYGGNKFGMYDRTMMKPYAHDVDLVTGEVRQLKEGMQWVYNDLFENSSFARNLVITSLEQQDAYLKSLYPNYDISIYDQFRDRYNETVKRGEPNMEEAMFDTYQWIIQQSKWGEEIRNSLILQFSDPSTSKIAVSNVNNWNPEEGVGQNLQLVKNESSNFKVVLNPYQDINNYQNLKIPVQLIDYLGVGDVNHDTGMAVKEDLSDLTKMAISDISREVNSIYAPETIINSKEAFAYKFGLFLRKKGVEALKQAGDVTGLADILNNLEVSIQMSAVKTKLMQSYINYISKQTISIPFNGLKLNQSTGYLIDIHRDSNGNAYLRKDLKARGVNPIDNDLFTIDKLKPMEQKDDGTTMGEYGAPYPYKKQFGIKPGETLADVFTLWLKVDGVLRYLDTRGMTNEKIEEVLNDYQLDEERTIAFRETGSKKGVIEYLNNFDASLVSLEVRIPTDSLGSAGVYKYAFFVEGDGNTGYFPWEKNGLDGTDQDIDQVNVYLKTIDEKGKAFMSEGKSAKNKDEAKNSIHQKAVELYLSKENQENIFMTADVKELKTLAEKQELPSMTDNEAFTFFELHKLVQVNEHAIPGLATQAAVFSLMSQVGSKLKTIAPSFSSIIQNNALKGAESFFKKGGNYFLLALDDIKYMALGRLGITHKNINLIFPLIKDGNDPIEIKDFMNEFMVKRVYRTVEYGDNISVKTSDHTIYKVIDRMFREMNTKTIQIASNPKVSYSQLTAVDIAQLKQELKSLSGKDFDVKEKQIDNSGDPSLMIKDVLTDEELIRESERMSAFDDMEVDYEDTDVPVLDKKALPTTQVPLAVRKRIREIKRALHTQHNIDVLNKLISLVDDAEIMRRINAVSKLRSGIPNDEFEFNKMIENLALYMGQTKEDYFNNKKYESEKLRVEAHMAYYEQNSNAYINEPDGLVKQFLRSTEERIASKMNLSEMLRALPNYDGYLRVVDKIDKDNQNIWLKDKPFFKKWDGIYFKNQNLASYMYRNQFYAQSNAKDHFIMDGIIKEVYKGREFNVAIPFKALSDIMTIDPQDIFKQLDITTRKGKGFFLLQLPQFIMHLKALANSDNGSVGMDLLRPGQGEQWYNAIRDNRLIERMDLAGNTAERGFLSIQDVNNINPNTLSDLRAEFVKLPSELKELLTVYTLINDGLTKHTMMMDIIGIDSLKVVSKEIDNIHNRIREGIEPSMKVVEENVNIAEHEKGASSFTKDVTRNNKHSSKKIGNYVVDKFLRKNKDGNYEKEELVFPLRSKPYSFTGEDFPATLFEEVLHQITPEQLNKLSKGIDVTIPFYKGHSYEIMGEVVEGKESYKRTIPYYTELGMPVYIHSKDSKSITISTIHPKSKVSQANVIGKQATEDLSKQVDILRSNKAIDNKQLSVMDKLVAEGQISKFWADEYTKMRDQRMAPEMLAFVVDRMRKAFPNTKITEETRDSIRSKYLSTGLATPITTETRGWKDSDGIHLNYDVLGWDTPMHELSHLWFDLLNEMGHKDAIKVRQEAERLIEENHDIVKIIKSIPAYRGISQNMLISEVVATIGGFTSADNIMQMYEKNGFFITQQEADGLFKRIWEAIKDAWNTIKGMITEAFSGEVMSDAIKEVSTIRDFTNNLMNAVLSGKIQFDIDSDQYRVVYNASMSASVNSSIKEGVAYVFDSTPELLSIGNEEQYSRYLDTIFPDSKVKDIVYHGANEPIEGEKFVKREGATGRGIWFSGSRKYAQIQMDRAQPSESLIGRKLRGAPTMYQVVLNIKNPKNFYNATGALLVQTPSKFEEQYDRKNNDAALFHHPNSKKPATADSADQVVVFEPEQIHILGSKQDIEGFKKFVKKDSTSLSSMPNFKVIDKISDFVDNFYANKYHKPTFDQMSSSQKEDYIYRSLTRYKDSWSYSSYKLADEHKQRTEDEIRKWIRDTVLVGLSSTESNLKTNLITFINTFNSNDNDIEAAANKAFGEEHGYDYNTLKSFVYYAGLSNPIKEVLEYNKLKGHSNPAISKLYNASFEGYNPLVIIHSISGDKVDLSIIDPTTSNLGNPGKYNSTHSFLSSFMNDRTFDNKGGMNVSDQPGDIRKVLIAMQIMAMKKQGNVAIRNVGALQINRNKVSQYLITDFNMFIRNIEIMKNEASVMLHINNDDINAILKDKSLYKANYEQSWVTRLFIGMLEKAEDKAFEGHYKYEKWYESLSKGGMNKYEMVNILKQMATSYKQYFKGEVNELYRDPFYQMIARSIQELQLGRPGFINDVKNISKLAEKILPTYFQNSDIFKNFNLQVIKSKSRVVDTFKAFRDDMSEITSKVLAAYNGPYTNIKASEWLKDTGSQYFEHLYKTVDAISDKKMKHPDGTMMEAGKVYKVRDIGKVHWSLKDTDTKALFDGRKITQLELDYMNKILDHIEKELKHQLTHLLRMEGKVKADGTNDFTEEFVNDELVRRGYRRGTLPIFNKSMNEFLMEGRFKDSMAGFLDLLGNFEKLFDDEKFDYTELDVVSGSLLGILDQERQLEEAGLHIRDGKLFVHDIMLNTGMSANIEKVAAYSILGSIRKRIYEEEIIPIYNTSNAVITMLEQSNIEQKNVRSLLEDYFRRVVHRDSQDPSAIIKTPWVDIDMKKVVRGVVASTTFIPLAFRVITAIKSLTFNQLDEIIKGFAVTLAEHTSKNGEHWMPNASEWAEANVLFFKNVKRSIAWARKYQVIMGSELDMLENMYEKQTDRHIFNAQMASIMANATDEFTRVTGMIAMMLKHDTWDAHKYDEKTGNTSYDIKLDKRFSGKDGKILTEKGEYALLKSLKQSMVNDGTLASMDSEMNRGYDYENAQRFKTYKDFVIGAMSSDVKSALSTMWYMTPLTQFRQFLGTKLGQMGVLNEEDKSIFLRKEKAVLNENGEYEIEYEYPVMAKTFQSWVKAVKALGDIKEKGLGQVWDDYPAENKQKIYETMFKVFIGASFFYIASTIGDDEEKNKKNKWSWQRERRFAWLYADLFTSFSVAQIANNPFASISMLQDLVRTFPNSDKMFNIVGPVSSYKTIKGVVSNEDENN